MPSFLIVCFVYLVISVGIPTALSFLIIISDLMDPDTLVNAPEKDNLNFF